MHFNFQINVIYQAYLAYFTPLIFLPRGKFAKAFTLKAVTYDVFMLIFLVYDDLANAAKHIEVATQTLASL